VQWQLARARGQTDAAIRDACWAEASSGHSGEMDGPGDRRDQLGWTKDAWVAERERAAKGWNKTGAIGVHFQVVGNCPSTVHDRGPMGRSDGPEGEDEGVDGQSSGLSSATGGQLVGRVWLGLGVGCFRGEVEQCGPPRVDGSRPWLELTKPTTSSTRQWHGSRWACRSSEADGGDRPWRGRWCSGSVRCRFQFRWRRCAGDAGQGRAGLGIQGRDVMQKASSSMLWTRGAACMQIGRLPGGSWPSWSQKLWGCRRALGPAPLAPANQRPAMRFAGARVHQRSTSPIGALCQNFPPLAHE